jgi:hypothetical protein
MTITTKEKLQLLGFQFWKKKNLSLPKSKNKDLFYFYNSLLFAFSEEALLNISDQTLSHFIKSVEITLFKNQKFTVLDNFSGDENITRAVIFGNNQFLVNTSEGLSITSTSRYDSLENFFSSPKLKKEFWEAIRELVQGK